MTKSEKIDHHFIISEVRLVGKVDEKEKTITITQKRYCEMKGWEPYMVQQLAKRGFKLIMQD